MKSVGIFFAALVFLLLSSAVAGQPGDPEPNTCFTTRVCLTEQEWKSGWCEANRENAQECINTVNGPGHGLPRLRDDLLVNTQTQNSEQGQEKKKWDPYFREKTADDCRATHEANLKTISRLLRLPNGRGPSADEAAKMKQDSNNFLSNCQAKF